MKISCVLNEAEVSQEYSDLILFPEGVPLDYLTRTSETYPSAIVIGACIKDRKCRGYAFHKSKNYLEHFKEEDDGRTEGNDNTDQNPIIELNDFCVGILVGKDIHHPEFSNKIVAHLRASKVKTKVLCIPSDLNSLWFSSHRLPDKYQGFYVALCNHNTHPSRCKSFIADAEGLKVSVQRDLEPIFHGFGTLDPGLNLT